MDCEDFWAIKIVWDTLYIYLFEDLSYGTDKILIVDDLNNIIEENNEKKLFYDAYDCLEEHFSRFIEKYDKYLYLSSECKGGVHIFDLNKKEVVKCVGSLTSNKSLNESIFKVKGDYLIICSFLTPENSLCNSPRNYIQIYNLKKYPLMDKVFYEFKYEGNQIKNIDIVQEKVSYDKYEGNRIKNVDAIQDKIYFEYFEQDDQKIVCKTLVYVISNNVINCEDWERDEADNLFTELVYLERGLKRLSKNVDLNQYRMLVEGKSQKVIHKVFCKICKEAGSRYRHDEDMLNYAKWLVEIRPDIDISADNEKAFRSACGKRGEEYRWVSGTPDEPPNFDLMKWLLKIKPDIDISADNEYAFYRACVYGRIDIAEWLLHLKPDINLSVKSYLPFRAACHQGELDMAQWVFALISGDDVDIDIYENAFIGTCHGGYLEVSKWLLKIKPEIDVSSDDEYAFIGACKCGHMKTVKWLLEIKPDIDVTANEHSAFTESSRWDKFNVAKFLKDLRPDVYNLDTLDDLFINEPDIAKMMRDFFKSEEAKKKKEEEEEEEEDEEEDEDEEQ